MAHPLTANCSAPELRKQLDADEFMQQLSQTTLFEKILPANLPITVLEEICRQKQIIQVNKNLPLKLQKGCLYEILSGYVKITDRPNLPKERISATRTKPSPALLAWRVPNELLGDFQFFLTDHPLRDHIYATDDCQLLMIPNEVINSIARYEPQIYLNIAANLAEKTAKARVRAQILRLPTIKCKIAKLFLELLEERGIDPEITDCDVLNGTFHIQDIAAFLGNGNHRTQQGIQMLMDDEILGHYQHDRSGRYTICKKDVLEKYFERSFLEAKTKRNKNDE